MSVLDSILNKVLPNDLTLDRALYTYGGINDPEAKRIVLAGLLTAADEVRQGYFKIDSLIGHSIVTDGEKVYVAIEKNITRKDVIPLFGWYDNAKMYDLIINSPKLSEYLIELSMTPIRYFIEYLLNHVDIGFE